MVRNGELYQEAKLWLEKVFSFEGIPGCKGKLYKMSFSFNFVLGITVSKVYAHMCSILEKHLNPTLGFHSFHICMFLNLDYDLLTELMHIFDKSSEGVLLIKVF